MKKFLIVLIIIAVFVAPRAIANGYIGSRDFGSDDAELLMKLAQSELGESTARDKASLMLAVLKNVWDTGNSIEQTIMNGGFDSIKNGKFFTAVPDDNCKEAVEMIYSGWNGIPADIGLVMAYKLVRFLEVALPFLAICFFALLFALISMSLANLQEKMLKRIRENNLKNTR